MIDASNPNAFTIGEDYSALQTISGEFTATDPDGDTITWSLGTGVPSIEDVFSINAECGYLATATGAKLDFETTSSYTFDVIAHDGKGATDSVSVTITVTNADDAGTVTFDSTDPAVGTTLTATLADEDGGVTGETWVWASSSDYAPATPDSAIWTIISGATTDTYTPVAGDVGNYLQSTASYTDSFGPNKSASAATAKAVVANSAPVIDDIVGATYAFSIYENYAVVIGSFSATDADGDNITWSLSGADASFFTIGTTGILSQNTGTTLDYESGKTTYSFTVVVSDDWGGTDTLDVTITILNEEEAGTVSIAPASPVAGTELTATLSDEDGVTTGTVTWVWASSTSSSGPFAPISGATTDKYTPKAGDVGNHLQATATYTDSFGPNKTASAVTASAVAAANNAPEFTAGATAERAVDENTAAGQNIGAPVSATDSDGDDLFYFLGGSDEESFTIDADTGQVRTKAALDYERKSSYDLEVHVLDGKDAEGGANWAIVDDTITLTITVTDVDTEAPSAPAAPTVQAASVTSLTVTWTEPDNTGPDITDYDVQYRVVGQPTWTTEAPGTADSTDTTRTLTGLTEGTEYEVQVGADNAEGPGGWSDSGKATPSTPPANPAPVFASATRDVAANDKIPAGAALGEPVTASDTDDDTVTYSLADDAGGSRDHTSFAIDADSGQLSVGSAVTLTSGTNYVFKVVATDTGDVTASIEVTVEAAACAAVWCGQLTAGTDDDYVGYEHGEYGYLLPSRAMSVGGATYHISDLSEGALTLVLGFDEVTAHTDLADDSLSLTIDGTSYALDADSAGSAGYFEWDLTKTAPPPPKHCLQPVAATT